ncbi:hypothetical protein Pcinc_018558 [Petrolisthes cinctipes]|uniref:Uncharacterized protein n=1 Tax=Petrolisthes cinctipes TaxID=88211 RepID=A0AAE1FMQ5_PETCI|nr:hypothetical protein Pcinc_018558 [Petrolisthes cinctipes]
MANVATDLTSKTTVYIHCVQHHVVRQLVSVGAASQNTRPSISTMAVCLLFLGFLLDPALGGYLITTPRQWISERPAQMCVSVEHPNATAGTLHVALVDHQTKANHHQYYERADNDYEHVLISSTNIDIPAGVNKPHQVAGPGAASIGQWGRPGNSAI